MKKFSVALISLLTLVVGAFAGPYDDWTHFREVTINTANSGGGANVTTPLTDIPVLVRLSDVDAASGSDVLAAAGVDGASLRFADANGNLSLPFDIQHWSASRAAIWVRVPVVEGNATTTIRMFWGNELVSGASDPGAVFHANNGYMAAWHLGNGSGAEARPNAVTGGNPAVPGGSETASMIPVPGIIGMADTLRSQEALDNTTRDHFSVGGGYADFSGGVTMSVWAFPITVGNWQKFIEIGNGAPNMNIGLGRENNTQNFQFEYYTGTDWGNSVSTVAAGAIEQNTWQYLAATTGPDHIRRVYKNGVLVAGPAGPGNPIPVVTRNSGYIGRTNFNDRQYRGKMEAMRIANVARSSDWLKFEYENQRAGATAVTLAASVSQASTFAYGNVSRTYTVFDEIIPNTPVVNGTVEDISVSPALPAGLTLNPLTGVISGTPTATTAEDVYTITAVFSDPDVTITADLTITVNPLAPTDLVYPATAVVYAMNQEIAPNIPTVNSLSNPNQLVDTFTVSPALPEGLTLNPVTGVITGTPTASSPATNYTVSATNTKGSASQVLNISIPAAPGAPVYSQNPVTITGGLAAPIVPLTATATGAEITWSVNPALPAGLSIDPATGTISGTPAASAAGPYTVSATNISGSATVNLDLTVTAPENYGSWTGTAEFILNTAAAGATTQQTGYPLLVRLTSAHADIFAGANEDGSDIRFSKADGTRLAYETESWDKPGTAAAFWVLLDTLPVSGTVALRIHHGNSTATSLSNGARVFNTASGFQAVWHMNGGTGNETDVTANGFLATQSGTPTEITSGAIGAARGFNGSNQWFQVNGSAGSVLSFPINGNYSVSTWALFTAGSGDNNRTMISKHDREYALSLGNPSSNWQFFQHSNNGWPSVTAPKTNGVWQQVTGVKDGANTYLYVNGVQTIGPITSSNPAGRNLGTDLFLGRRGDQNQRHWRGNMDEVRMSNVSRSADWAKLDYETQVAGAVPISGLAYESATYSFSDDGDAIIPISAPTLQTGSATSFSISPALPPDLSLNTATGAITGTPKTFMAATPFVVTARSGAWVATQTLTLEISPTPPGNIAYGTNTVVYQAGLPSTTTTPTFEGSITSWSITPALPAGLNFNTSTGVISGEPLAAAAAADYEVIGTGPEGSDTVDVAITVLASSEEFSTWSNNRNIILNTSASGSNVANTVTNFPVLVRLGQAEASIFSQALAEGADVRFAKANGVTRLPYEIVSWDAGANKAEIWVKVDSVYGNNSTQFIRMYWGKGGSVDSTNSPAVFGSSNGFAAVWHMGGTAGNEIDATANAYVAVAANAPVDTVGMTGRARNFNGTNQVFAVTGTAGGALNFQMTDNYSISSWVYATKTDLAGDGVQILNKGDNQYTLGAYGSNGNQKIWEVMTRGNNGYLSAKSDGSSPVINVANSAHRWLHITGTYRGGAAGQAIAETLYIDGNVVGTFSGTNNDNNGRNTNFDVHLGALAGGTAPGSSFARHFVGNMDEIRVANVTRTKDWVRLDFESQKMYQSLTNIGLQAPTVVYTPDSLVYLQNATITAVSPAVASGPVTNWSITPALPSGLSLNASTGAITGAPLAVHAATTHTITAVNAGGSTSDSIVLTVNPGPPADLSYTLTPVTYYTGVTIDTNFATVTGEVESFTVSPALPEGLSLDESTGAITGSPTTVTAQTVYTVSAHNATGTATADVDITVLIPVPAAPVISSPANDALAVPVPFTVVWNTVLGTVDSYQFQGSEDGFATVGMDTTLATTSLLISDAPYATALSVRVRAINSTGAGEWSSVVSFTTIDAPPAITYATTPVIYTVGLEMTPNTPDTTGSGPITGYAISPDLTAATGLAFNTTTGAITGTPTQDAAPADYTVVASGPGGTDEAVVNIGTSSEPPPMVAYALDTLVFVKDAAITSVTLSIDSTLGGPIDSFSVAPAFPAGLSLNDSTGEITGTPTVVAATTSYVVTTHGLGGVDKDTVVITVNDIAPVIAYAVDTVVYAAGTEITPLTPSSTGGAVISWSMTPDLAGLTGLTFSATTGVLSGTPANEEPAGLYTIVATNSGGTDTALIHVTVQGAPVVTTAPHDTAVVSGAAASFNVAATALGTLSYQWRKGTTNLVNGTGIAGVTSDTLKLTGVALADTGSYNVVVTSTLSGTTTNTTSTGGTLRVNTTPVIATQPHDTTVVSGANASFMVAGATGLGSSAGTLSYQWRKGTTNLTNGGKVTGATSATLTITGAALADTASTYNVVVTRTLFGTTTSVTSGNAALRVNAAPVISGQPANRTAVAGASAGFKVAATVAGGGTLTYQWRKGTTNLTNGANVVGATSDTLTLSGLALADTGAYNVVVTSTLNSVPSTTTSGNATLSVNAAPVISGQPAARTVVAGTSAGFKVAAAAGAGSSAGTLTYQWRKGTTNLTNGANVVGATSDTLTLSNVAMTDTSANYNVVVTRTLNGTTTTTTSSNTALRVNAAPVISGQPANRTVVAAGAAGFKVTASVAGGGVLSYQWRKGTTNLTNGSGVTGATSDTLTVSNAALADTAANYNVVVTSTLNGVTTTTTSSNATLLVNAAPTITTQPAATALITVGSNLNLTVVVAGGPGASAGTLTYQWRKGSTNLTNAGRISGATSANLLITAAVAADTGTYSVVVTRTLNGTTTTVTSTNSVVQQPVSIMPGSFVFRVSGAGKQYTFQLPAGAVTTEKVTMSISDVWGRTLWTHSIYPSRDAKAREIVWNGATSTGRQAAAGMYIVKLAVQDGGQTTRYVQKSVTLKPTR